LLNRYVRIQNVVFILYNGNEGYSQEARPTRRVHEIQWGLVRRNVARILRMANYTDAAETLANLPFELWEATNAFGDQFELLTMKVPVKTYLEIEMHADTYHGKECYNRIAQAMEQANCAIRFIGMDADMENSATIPTPQLQTTSVGVSRALSDFEVLISSSGGPISGVDRIHTALHGYLKAVCDESGIVHSDDADITTLFKLMREQHPKLQTHPPAVDGTNILRGLARVVDALNPVRNRHSMAHPSEELLDEPEALLAVNAVKSVLHYLNMKLR